MGTLIRKALITGSGYVFAAACALGTAAYSPVGSDWGFWLWFATIPIAAYSLVRGLATLGHSRSTHWNGLAGDAASGFFTAIFEIVSAVAVGIFQICVVIGLGGLAIVIVGGLLQWASAHIAVGMIVLSVLLGIVILMLCVALAKLGDVASRLAHLEATAAMVR